MRRPNPVLIIPREMKNAASTNHTTGSAYPARADFSRNASNAFGSVTVLAKASLTGMALVIINAEMPINTIAPPGTGRTMEPTIVAAKIASKRHDCGVTPSGIGAR